uniref:Arsenite methyltransferase n=1 Tax=Ciona savignyi TaxID=51511 RepID=H2YGP5_CIOSA
HVKRAISLVHEDVASRYFGCGLAVPFDQLEGLKVVDLGCGSGRDCYAIAQLVGENGEVIGVDMTKEQLDIARKYEEYHRVKFGFKESNVRFVEGYIEDLSFIADSSVDIAISNCVVNLCENKEAVFKEVFRILKTGGEFYWSDIYSDREVPLDIQQNEVLWGEGMGGAMFWEYFHQLTESIGFEISRIITAFPVVMKHPELKDLIGDVKYVSVLYRMFKLGNDIKKIPCAVTYKGTIKDNHEMLKFDRNSTFATDDTTQVDGVTAATLRSTRFSPHFEFSNTSVVQDQPVSSH